MNLVFTFLHGIACSRATRSYNAELVFRNANIMSKLKTHKGTRKRVSITGRKKVKFKRAFTSHLMSHMSGNKVRKLRKHRTVKKGDIGRLRKLLNIRVIRGDADDNTARAARRVELLAKARAHSQAQTEAAPAVAAE